MVRPEDNPAYRSVDAFLAAYPTCCRLVDRGREGFVPGLLERMSGFTHSIVAIAHDVIYRDYADRTGDRKPFRHTDFVLINACGGVREWSDVFLF